MTGRPTRVIILQRPGLGDYATLALTSLGLLLSTIYLPTLSACLVGLLVGLTAVTRLSDFERRREAMDVVSAVLGEPPGADAVRFERGDES